MFNGICLKFGHNKIGLVNHNVCRKGKGFNSVSLLVNMFLMTPIVKIALVCASNSNYQCNSQREIDEQKTMVNRRQFFCCEGGAIGSGTEGWRELHASWGICNQEPQLQW